MGSIGALRPWRRRVAWVFTRTAGVWTQQGNKLVSTDAVGRQGTSVALSADGNIAILGGFADDGGVALVFTRSGGYWTEDKSPVGTGVAAKAAPSASVDRSIVMVGRSNDNGGAGAATVFTRRGGGSDSQELARPSTTSNPAVNFEE